MQSVSILLADGDTLFRQCLRRTVEEDTRTNLCMEAENGLQTLLMTQQNRPSLVVLDAQMPRLDGIEATRILRRRNRSLQIVVISVFEDARTQALEAGADYFLMKDCGFDVLHRLIHRLTRIPA